MNRLICLLIFNFQKTIHNLLSLSFDEDVIFFIISVFQILLLSFYMIKDQHSKLKLWIFRTLLYWCLTSPPKCPWKDICQYIIAWMCLQRQHCHTEMKKVQNWWDHCVVSLWNLVVVHYLRLSEDICSYGLWAQVHRLDRESSGLILMGRTKESFTRLHWLFTSVKLARTTSQVSINSLITEPLT